MCVQPVHLDNSAEDNSDDLAKSDNAAGLVVGIKDPHTVQVVLSQILDDILQLSGGPRT